MSSEFAKAALSCIVPHPDLAGQNTTSAPVKVVPAHYSDPVADGALWLIVAGKSTYVAAQRSGASEIEIETLERPGDLVDEALLLLRGHQPDDLDPDIAARLIAFIGQNAGDGHQPMPSSSIAALVGWTAAAVEAALVRAFASIIAREAGLGRDRAIRSDTGQLRQLLRQADPLRLLKAALLEGATGRVAYMNSRSGPQSKLEWLARRRKERAVDSGDIAKARSELEGKPVSVAAIDKVFSGKNNISEAAFPAFERLLGTPAGGWRPFIGPGPAAHLHGARPVSKPDAVKQDTDEHLAPVEVTPAENDGAGLRGDLVEDRPAGACSGRPESSPLGMVPPLDKGGTGPARPAKSKGSGRGRRRADAYVAPPLMHPDRKPINAAAPQPCAASKGSSAKDDGATES